MKQESHLYPGFRFAGRLPSVASQRQVQGELLSSLDISKMLIVGSGFGEEANILIKHLGSTARGLQLSVVDLADVYHQLCAQPSLWYLRSKLCFYQADLLESQKIDGFGKFDLVQCGFVLHDFQPHQKDSAVNVLASSVRSGGYVLISDIFLSAENSVSDVADVYQGFLSEAEGALQVGSLKQASYSELVGDGVCMGLERTMQEALCGNRDYFETSDSLIRRAKLAGLELIEICRNPKSRYMSSMLFQQTRPQNIFISSEERHYVI